MGADGAFLTAAKSNGKEGRPFGARTTLWVERRLTKSILRQGRYSESLERERSDITKGKGAGDTGATGRPVGGRGRRLWQCFHRGLWQLADLSG
jgi:hypothetical protein